VRNPRIVTRDPTTAIAETTAPPAALVVRSTHAPGRDRSTLRPCAPGDPPPDRPADEPAANSDGAATHERLVRDLQPRARVLALASGKGGVGKTNVAVNLAIGLSAAGRRVLLVDADIGLANVDLVLGRRPRGHLGHVLAGRVPLEAVVQEGPAGIHWVPGAAHLPEAADLDEASRRTLLAGLAALEQEHDYLILDLPAGIGRSVVPFVRQADELVLVTTPEPPAILDAYTLLKATVADPHDGPSSVGLIVNMVGHRRDALRVHERLAATAKQFLKREIALLGYVFCDGHVGRAVQKQQPLALAYPHSQAAWCLKQIAGVLLNGSKPPEGRRCAFLRRLANLLAGTTR